MVTDSHTSKNVLTLDSVDEFEMEVDVIKPLLPRSAWDSKAAFLRVVGKMKKLLDEIESEAGILKSKN